MSTEASPPAAHSSPSEPSALLRALVAILTIAFLVKPYLLDNELVHDGRKMATRHEVLSQVPAEPGRITETLTTSWWGDLDPNSGLYRPISSFVLGLAGIVSGESYDVGDSAKEDRLGQLAMPYKLFALALKVICALLVIELAWLYLGNSSAAIAAGLLFATLPVHGEVLFDVVGIAELLAAAFGLAAWAAWLRGTEPDGTKPLQLGLCAGLVFLASLSKESAFALPLVFFLGDLGRGTGGLKRALAGIPGHVLLAIVLLGSLALRYAVLGSLTPDYNATIALVNPLADADFATRAMNGLRLLALSFPAMLGYQTLSSNGGYSVDYSFSQIEALPAFAPANLIAVGVLTAGVVLAFVLMRKMPRTAALFLAAIGALLLTSNVFFVSGTAYGDRLLFFASASFVMMIGGLLGRLGMVGVVAALALSLSGGAYTWQRSGDWSNSFDLWKVTAKETATDSALAHFNLGVSQATEGLDSFARQEFNRTLELYPGFVDARMALAQLDSNDDQRYTEHLRAALETMFERDNYTWSKEQTREIARPSILLELLTQRMAIEPGLDPAGHLAWLDEVSAKGYESPYIVHRRADTLRGMGRLEEAESELRRSIAIAPTPSAVGGLVRFLRLSGRSEEASELLDEHLALLEETREQTDGAYLEFLLIRAETELASSPAQALKSAEQVLALEPQGESRLRALTLRAQATLDVAPNEVVANAKAARSATNDLISGLQAFPFDSPSSEVAVSMLGTLLPKQGNEQARGVLEAALENRESPSMRSLLGSVYYRLGDHERAATQFELALAGFTEPDASSEVASVWTEVRLLQLHNLSQLDTPEAQAQILSLLDEDRASAGDRGLHVRRNWFAAQGQFSSAREAIQGLSTTLSSNEIQPMLGLMDHMEGLHQRLAVDPDDVEALSNLAFNEKQLQARPQALEHARRAVELSEGASDEDRALRLLLLSRTLADAKGPEAGLDPLRQALKLTQVSSEGRSQIERELAVLEALLDTASS